MEDMRTFNKVKASELASFETIYKELANMRLEEIKEIPLCKHLYIWAERNSNGDDTYGYCIEVHDKLQEYDTYLESFGIYSLNQFKDAYKDIKKFVTNKEVK